MVLNTTFNNILAISWRSVLSVEETGLSEQNQRPTASDRQTLSHNGTIFFDPGDGLIMMPH